MHRHSVWNSDRAREIVERIAPLDGPLMPALHALQEEFGYIHHEAVAVCAQVLNLSRAEVHGVVSFYRDFRTEPPGRHVIQICQSESCQAMNGRALARHAEEALGVAMGETTGDGMFTLSPVYCLGHCACSPAVMVDSTPYGRMDTERFDALIADLKARP